jgi:hypothetical protein
VAARVRGRSGAEGETDQEATIKASRLHVRRGRDPAEIPWVQKVEQGATSGSRVCFTSNDYGVLTMHMPHPGKELKPYQIKQLISTLEGKGLI